MWQYDLRQSQVPTICILFVPYETATHTHSLRAVACAGSVLCRKGRVPRYQRVLSCHHPSTSANQSPKHFSQSKAGLPIIRALQPIKGWAASHPSTSANQKLGCQSSEHFSQSKAGLPVIRALQPIKSWAASHPSTSANQRLGCQSSEHFSQSKAGLPVIRTHPAKSAGGRLQLNTHTPYVCGFAWSDTVHGCMVYTERAEMAAVSSVWHQPCRCCKYTTSVDIQKRALKSYSLM